jgi:nitrous oxidase accessory protein NosD
MRIVIGDKMVSNNISSGGKLRIAVGITMLVLLLASGAGATELVVCPSGCAYSSIQVAVYAASAGDTVTVNSGTYVENVAVNKQLILRGVNTGVGICL